MSTSHSSTWALKLEGAKMNLANKRPLRAYGDWLFVKSTKHGAGHIRNPAGSKFLRRAYKSALGERGTYEEALDWFKYSIGG